uniref:Uncharacterized protein n=1 Tax=Rangifer tarandus platyrhynchus TaxID=3082113 RepID=A0ACB0FCK3_RANTA|nr:unnamed protein product [Rangifer tarandus platyrhynchus]
MGTMEQGLPLWDRTQPTQPRSLSRSQRRCPLGQVISNLLPLTPQQQTTLALSLRRKEVEPDLSRRLQQLREEEALTQQRGARELSAPGGFQPPDSSPAGACGRLEPRRPRRRPGELGASVEDGGRGERAGGSERGRQTSEGERTGRPSARPTERAAPPPPPAREGTDGRTTRSRCGRPLARAASLPRVRRHGPAIGERGAPRGDSPRGPPVSQAGGGVGGGRRVAAWPGGGGAGVPGPGGWEDAGRFLASAEPARLRVRGRRGPRPPVPPPPIAVPEARGRGRGRRRGISRTGWGAPSRAGS